MSNIGTINREVDISYEYYNLALEDEKVAILLKNKGEYRHKMDPI